MTCIAASVWPSFVLVSPALFEHARARKIDYVITYCAWSWFIVAVLDHALFVDKCVVLV